MNFGEGDARGTAADYLLQLRGGRGRRWLLGDVRARVGVLDGLAQLLEGDDADEAADGGDVGVVHAQHGEQRVHLQQAALLDQLDDGAAHDASVSLFQPFPGHATRWGRWGGLRNLSSKENWDKEFI